MSRKNHTLKYIHDQQGDEVKIIAGNEKGYDGRVLVVFPAEERVLVEGVNMRVHHDKPTQDNPQGGRIEREVSIHISNVMVIDPSTGEPTRIGRKRIEEDSGGRWVRYAKNSGEIIDK